MTLPANNGNSPGFNWPLFLKVAAGHTLLLLVGFILFQVQSCRRKELPTIKAKLVTLPAPNRATGNVHRRINNELPLKEAKSPENKIKNSPVPPANKQQSRSNTRKKPIKEAFVKKPVKLPYPRGDPKKQIGACKKSPSGKY